MLRNISHKCKRIDVRMFSLILILLPTAVALGSEPIPLVASRWDWPAVKFNQEAQNDLGKGDLEGARRNIDEALRRAPTFWLAYYTRARFFVRERKWDLAIRDCNEVLRQYSAWVPAALLRARINLQIGNYSAAKREFDHIVAIQPRPQFQAMAFEARAWFRATCPDVSFRNPQGAIEDAKKACTITQWKEVNPLDTLATGYAAAGDFDSAVRYEQQAMQAYDAKQRAGMMEMLQKHLAVFKQHQRVTTP